MLLKNVLLLSGLLCCFHSPFVLSNDVHNSPSQCLDSDVHGLKRLIAQAQAFENRGQLSKAKTMYSRVLQLSKNKPLESRLKSEVLVATRQSKAALERLD